MANPTPGAWSEVCLVTLWDGTTTMEIASWLRPADLIQSGDREVTFEPSLAGGRIDLHEPEEDTEITIEGRFIGIGDTDDTSPDGMVSHFYDGTDSSAPYSVDNYFAAAVRKTFNIWILWSDDSTVASGTGAIVSGANAMRARCVAARFVSCKQSFSDGKQLWTLKFRIPARTKSGAKTITWESTDGTAAMTSLGTLTST